MPDGARLTVSDVAYTATKSADGLSIAGNLKLNFGGTSDGSWVSEYNIYYFGNDPSYPGPLHAAANLGSSEVTFGSDGFARVSFTANGLYQHAGYPTFSYDFELRATAGDGSYLPSATQGNSATTGP